MDVLFGEKALISTSYTINKVIPTNKYIQIVDPKKFVIAILDTSSKTFIIYMAIQK